MQFKINPSPQGSETVDTLIDAINNYNGRLEKLYNLKEFCDGVLNDYYHYMEFFDLPANVVMQLTKVLKQVLRKRREVYNEIAAMRLYQKAFKEGNDQQPVTKQLFDNNLTEVNYFNSLEARVGDLVYQPRVGDVAMLLSLKDVDLEVLHDKLIRGE